VTSRCEVGSIRAMAPGSSAVGVSRAITRLVGTCRRAGRTASAAQNRRWEEADFFEILPRYSKIFQLSTNRRKSLSVTGIDSWAGIGAENSALEDWRRKIASFLTGIATQSERDRGGFFGRGSVAGVRPVCRQFQAGREGCVRGSESPMGETGFFQNSYPERTHIIPRHGTAKNMRRFN
jgi:hypothetical protein